MQQDYLVEMRERFPVPMLQVPLLPHEIKGLDVLAHLGEELYGSGWPQRELEPPNTSRQPVQTPAYTGDTKP
jgi:hypothetical protein